jgi:hypothetical protein
MPAKLDPLSPRKKRTLTRKVIRQDLRDDLPINPARYASEVASTFWTDAELAFTYDSFKQDYASIARALDSPNLAKYFTGDFPEFDKLFSDLRRHVGVTKNPFNWSNVERSMPPPVALVSPKDLEFKVNPKFPSLHLFKKNCMACHIRQPDPRMNFMEASSDAALWKKLSSNPEVLRRISVDAPEAQRMPPANSRPGKLFRTKGAGERTQMLGALKGSAKFRCVSDRLRVNSR